MRVFVTGATGFIGTALVKQLLDAEHQVRGLARSEQGMQELESAGVEAHRGDITDLESLRSGASGVDAVVNLAFNHDFSRFDESAKEEIAAIETLGEALAPGKVLVVTSGIAIVASATGVARRESDPAVEMPAVPRRPEQAARAIAARKGLRLGIVRLPQVHDTRKQGLVTYLIALARAKGASAYVGSGENRWSAVTLESAAELYRLAVEKTGDGVTVYHAVDEEGVSLREIAETVGRGLNVPVLSIPPEQAAGHFGGLAHFAALDMPAVSGETQQRLSWKPTGPGLIEDLSNMQY